MKVLTLAAIFALSLAGCSAAPHAPPLTEGAVPGGVPLTGEHTLSPNDVVEIRFPYSPDLNDKVTIGADGYASPKLLGPVLLGGLTVPEATGRLKMRYATKIRSPEVAVTVRNYAPEAVYVDGWVARPGLIRSEVPLTIARAVARAGGAKTGAETSEVLLIRRSAAGKLSAYKVALGGYAGAEAQDPMLKSFDIVYVPKTALATVSDFLSQYDKNLPFAAGYQVGAEPTVTTQTLESITAHH
ncbi:MAG TPA: polysaccharide biosynthesis/export family protein [Stellaceae bacterium]|jgi:polysaccharide export outer membrane protein